MSSDCVSTVDYFHNEKILSRLIYSMLFVVWADFLKYANSFLTIKSPLLLSLSAKEFAAGWWS